MAVDIGEAGSLRRYLWAVSEGLSDEIRATHLARAQHDDPAYVALRDDIRSLAAAVAALIVKVDALASGRQAS